MKAQMPSFPDSQPSPLCGPVIPTCLGSSHPVASQPARFGFDTPGLKRLLPGRIKRPPRTGQGLCPGCWEQELGHETQETGAPSTKWPLGPPGTCSWKETWRLPSPGGSKAKAKLKLAVTRASGGRIGSPRATGGEAKGAKGGHGQMRTTRGHLTWVLMTGHLLVFGIQWPRRPGLFPQLHVWVPVRRGWDERTEFIGGPTNVRTGRVGMWWPDHHHPAVPSSARRQMAQGSSFLRDGGRMALFPHWTEDQPKTQPWGLGGWLTGCSHCAGAAPKSTNPPQGQPTVQHV